MTGILCLLYILTIYFSHKNIHNAHIQYNHYPQFPLIAHCHICCFVRLTQSQLFAVPNTVLSVRYALSHPSLHGDDM